MDAMTELTLNQQVSLGTKAIVFLFVGLLLTRLVAKILSRTGLLVVRNPLKT